MNKQTSFSKRFRSLAGRPHFNEPEMDRQAGVLFGALVPIFIVSVILIPALLVVGAPPVTLLPVVLMLGVEAVVYSQLNKGQLRQASMLFIFAGWPITTFPAFLQGGLTSPFALFTTLWVVVTGLLLERRYLVGMMIANMALVTAMLFTTTFNLIPTIIPPATPLRYWNIMMIVLFVAGSLLRIATTSMRNALTSAQSIQLDLENANRELVAARSDLEDRVRDRTTELERRARELQASANIVRAIASIREQDTLLSEIAHLLSDQFGFYNVFVFLSTEKNQELVLRAANTQPGRKLVESEFKIPFDRNSIVTTAIRTRKPYLAADVQRDPLYMPLEELPETRSELALPMFSGGQVLGVLDLQSTAPAAFTQADLSTLNTLASQIAIAIENAQLFAQNQQALESLQAAYASMSQEGWQRLLRAQPNLGYHVGRLGAPQPAGSEWQPEMVQAMNTGKIIQPDPQTLAVPIKIRDQVTGVIRLRKPDQDEQANGAPQGWTAAEVDLVATLSDRLSTAMESARLYEETRRRAERERLTGEITARMRASNDQQAILQIAAQELRKALQADKAQLTIQAIPVQPASDPAAPETTEAAPGGMQ